MNSDFRGALRRLKPEKHRTPLKPRNPAELDFIGPTSAGPVKLLYDTTVYIDILQGRFPRDGELTLRSAEAWHSPVTEAELSATCGLLDPTGAYTRDAVEKITAIIERRPKYRTIIPDSGIWRDAGVLSGIVARLQGYGKDQRRRGLNDALLFASARKFGCAVLTRNIVDFDFLQQLDPSGSVLFYK